MSKDPRIATILRVIQFVENNLRSPISVKDMAAEAGYSPYYFCALFSQFTHHSPYDYLIRRRMTEAVKQLVNSDFRVVDVAYEFQFDSHEGFTRAFRRIFSNPPNTIKLNQCLPYLSCLEALTEPHLCCLQAVKNLNPIVQRIESLPLSAGKPIKIQICWPETNSHNEPKEFPATHFLVVDFETTRNTQLFLDWILHTWLFFSSYRLSGSVITQITEKIFQVPLLPK